MTLFILCILLVILYFLYEIYTDKIQEVEAQYTNAFWARKITELIKSWDLPAPEDGTISYLNYKRVYDALIWAYNRHENKEEIK